tara:strand:+ start:156 stop:818 length:663 start_codon:yes stop_codon:yes gene_type:complete
MALNINGTTGISGVEGSVSAPVLTGTDSNCGISFPAADTIKFSTGGVERMAITNSGVSGITAGITMAETWRLTSNITNDGSENVITANLSKPSTPSGYGKVGTETMTVSSGVFTFPSTGIYYITANSKQYALGSGTEGNGNGIFINTTVNNSSYSRASYGSQAVPTTYDYGSASCHLIFDVTDVSTHKVRFSHSGVSGSVVAGNANDNQTHFLIMKLGDT